MSLRWKMAVVIVMGVFLLGISWSVLAAKKPYEGVKLTWLQSAGGVGSVITTSKRIAKELGIDLTVTEVPDEEHRELIFRDWKTGGGGYDIVTLLPKWNVDTMAMGYLAPLNQYLDKFDVWDTYNGIMEGYRKIYCEWNGKIYSFVQDGDISFLVYNKEAFENPSYQEKFRKKYGYELEPPNTYAELLDAAEFFTGWDWDNDGEIEYGMNHTFNAQIFVECDFLPIFGAMGGIFFDEEMNPLINSPAGVEALELMKKMLQFAPPGAVSMRTGEAFASFINGEVAIGLYYPDIGRLIYSPESFRGKGGPQWKGKMGYALWPAKKTETGELRRYCSMSWGRIMGVTSFSKNKEAAFNLIERMDRPENAAAFIMDATSGMDPFLYAFLDKKIWDEHNYPVDEEYLKIGLESVQYGYPELPIPGNEEYYEALRTNMHAYLAGMIKDPQTALDKVANQWNKITKRLGRDKQKKVWAIAWKRYQVEE